jgi:hypothetical protein
MVRRLVFAGLFALSAPAHSAKAAEAAPHVALRYDAPDACPDDAQLVASVEHFLGQPLREAREQELSVNVAIQSGPRGFAAKLSFKSPRGIDERFAEDAACSKLAEAAALLVALAIDPDRVHAQQAAAEAPAPPAEPKPEAPAAPPPAPPPQSEPCPTPPAPPAPARRRYGVAGASALVGIGVMPHVAPALGVDFGARVGRAQLELVGSYWLTGTADVAGSNPATIEISLATVGLRGCGVLPVSTWSLLGCAQGQLGDMAGSGQRVDAARTRHALFADVQAQFFAHYTRLEAAPWAGLGLAWQVKRPAFGLAQQSVADAPFRPSAVALLGYVGVALGP